MTSDIDILRMCLTTPSALTPVVVGAPGMQCHRRSIELEREVDPDLKVGISYFTFLLMMARLAIIELRFFRYVKGILYQDKGDR